jgi:hypothetical protein
MKSPAKGRTPMIASVVVIVLLVAALGFYYLSASGTISSLNSSISEEKGIVSAQSTTISNLNASISSLQGNASAYSQLVASLRGTIASYGAMITSDNETIGSLQSELASANALVHNLTTTVNLQASSVLVNAQSVTIYGNSTVPTPFLTFNPSYAGYLLVQVSGATQPYLAEADYTPTASNPSSASYQSLTGLTATSPGVTYYVLPVMPGSSESFALVSNSTGSGSATVTATYFY